MTNNAFDLLENLLKEWDECDKLVKELHAKGTAPNEFDKMKYKKKQAKLTELRNQAKLFIEMANDIPF